MGSASLEVLCAGKVMFVKVANVGKVETARNREGHRSAANLDNGVGGNGQSEEQSGQQGSRKHLGARNVGNSGTEWRGHELGWLLCVRCIWWAYRKDSRRIVVWYRQ